MITAPATVAGMFPLALAQGAGSQMLQPLAIAVTGGILASMVLSFVVTPAVHYYSAADTTNAQRSNSMKRFLIFGAMGFAALASFGFAQDSGPNKVLKIAKVGGEGNFDYVYADDAGRRLYVPRSGQGARVTVFDLDTLEQLGEIPNTNARGAAVDPKSGHGFASSKPVAMWDTKTLKLIKTIDVQGGPDGILFDPYNERVWVFSHSQPNATVIDAKDGSIAGTLDLGGAPEQAASDGKGHLYVDLEDKDSIAVVDTKALKVTATYSLGDKCGGPGGLGFDAKNHVLFASCHTPSVMAMVNSEDGKIITTLPIGPGTDGAGFNPKTMEAFSSNGGNGTLTVIKENSPTSFVVEQNVNTMPRAKTMTVDTKTNRVLLIAAEYGPPPAPPADAPKDPTKKGGRGGRAPMLPDSFSIIVVGNK
jgi:DNA-binding beta-propeller fold protein YncE